jgi:hypothetical protein
MIRPVKSIDNFIQRLSPENRVANLREKIQRNSIQTDYTPIIVKTRE